MKTAQIRFKAKIQHVYNMDDTLAYSYVPVPLLTRSHCDMDAFREHPKYGPYANSNMFPGMLGRIRKDMFPDIVNGSPVIKIGAIPIGVAIDVSGFLAKITITVPN